MRRGKSETPLSRMEMLDCRRCSEEEREETAGERIAILFWGWVVGVLVGLGLGRT